MIRTYKALLAVVVAAALVIGTAGPALAHDPIFITDDQTTPDTGPFMPDGTISWALYGTVLEATDTRGFEFDLRDGDELFVSLLIPNISPEVDLSDDELPTLELEAPDGSVVSIGPEIREVFDEPFSGTSYVTLSEYRMPGQAGRYRGVVIGNAPARFSVAIGESEIFFTETERSGDRPSNFAEISVPLTAWYTTLPGGEQDLSTLEEGQGEIDLDLIDEAMDDGVAVDSTADEADGSQEPQPASASEADVDDATTTAEPEDAPADDEAAQSSDAGQPDEATQPDEVAGVTETASGPIADTGGGATYVAPIVIGVIAIAGAAFFALRRGTTSA